MTVSQFAAAFSPIILIITIFLVYYDLCSQNEALQRKLDRQEIEAARIRSKIDSLSTKFLYHKAINLIQVEDHCD